MIVGIVGSEAAKFTKATEFLARKAINEILNKTHHVVSGKCHLGGIDIWAIEEAVKRNIPYTEYAPSVLSWEHGYKPRNNAIARNSEAVYCITVKELPEHYKGMRFDFCYHCGTNNHVKSGGCWTVKRAKMLGRYGEIIVVG